MLSVFGLSSKKNQIMHLIDPDSLYKIILEESIVSICKLSAECESIGTIFLFCMAKMELNLYLHNQSTCFAIGHI